MLKNTTTWDQWLYAGAPLVAYLLLVGAAARHGDPGNEAGAARRCLRRISTCLERSTGFRGWAAAGAVTTYFALTELLIGFYWDVGFHENYGRDDQLFTPSHTMIILGLAGLLWAALVAIVLANRDDARVGFRWGSLRVPWTAGVLLVLGIGGELAFALDAMWHNAYGIDVTLWSPAHMQLLASGSLATIAPWLMLAEGGRSQPTRVGRILLALHIGSVLTGLSAFQAEFDFGVPQFQSVYRPLLIGLSAGFALVLARLVLGKWGPLTAVAAYLASRGIVALLVGGPFNETIPVFPLYVMSALGVEAAAAFLGTHRRLRFAVVSGVLAGTVGTVADIVWLTRFTDVNPSWSLLPKGLVLATMAAVAAAVVGAALGRVVPGGTRIRGGVTLAAGLGLIVVLAYPLPRHVGVVEAVIRLRPVGDRATVEVELEPGNAADSATTFGVLAWRGGGRVSTTFRKVGDGRYVSSQPVPVTGRWHTLVTLERGDEVMAAATYMGSDAEGGTPVIPAVAERQAKFERDTTLMLREGHPGNPAVAVAAYSVIAVVVLCWITMFAVCATRISSTGEASGRPADEIDVDRRLEAARS